MAFLIPQRYPSQGFPRKGRDWCVLGRLKIGARGLSEISRIYGTVRLVGTVGTVGTVCWYA